VEAPEPPEERLSIWEAFTILSDSRQMGMTQGPIPLTEIESYLRMMGIRSKDECWQWLHLIRELDREYMQYQSEQEKTSDDTRTRH